MMSANKGTQTDTKSQTPAWLMRHRHSVDIASCGKNELFHLLDTRRVPMAFTFSLVANSQPVANKLSSITAAAYHA